MIKKDRYKQVLDFIKDKNYIYSRLIKDSVTSGSMFYINKMLKNGIIERSILTSIEKEDLIKQGKRLCNINNMKIYRVNRCFVNE